MTLRPVGGDVKVSRQVEVALSDRVVEFEVRETDGRLMPGNYSAQLQLTTPNGNPIGEFLRLILPDAPSSLGESVLLRRSAATGQRYARTADPRFRRNERLRLELPTDATDPVTAALRDSRGIELAVPVEVTEREDESGAFRWVVVDVPVIPLAPADYAVVVTQGSESRITAFRVAP